MSDKQLVKFKCDRVTYAHGGTIVYVMVPPDYKTGRFCFPVPSVKEGIEIEALLNGALEFGDLITEDKRLREALAGMYRIYSEIDGREDVIHSLEECKLARQALKGEE